MSATAPVTTPTAGKFVTGSTLTHVLNMTATGPVGLIAIFAVDLLKETLNKSTHPKVRAL